MAEKTSWYQGTFELNPLGVEALKSIAYELAEQIEGAAWVVAPMGSGGTIHALWKGFRELKVSGRVSSTPRLVGVQAEGCSPVVHAFL